MSQPTQLPMPLKKYRSTRGAKSHRRDRCTLHKTHLEAFTNWLTGQPYKDSWWVICKPSKHPYEVLQAELMCNSGSNGHSFIYRNDHNDHLTVQANLVPMVKLWLKERKQNG